MNFIKYDNEFSKYIRLKYADENGICSCYTCGNNYYWKYIQNGHFFSRAHILTRYHENNCRPQCLVCNVQKDGNLEIYKKKLIKEIGKDEFNVLIELKKIDIKIMKYELDELLIFWRAEIKRMLKVIS